MQCGGIIQAEYASNEYTDYIAPIPYKEIRILPTSESLILEVYVSNTNLHIDANKISSLKIYYRNTSGSYSVTSNYEIVPTTWGQKVATEIDIPDGENKFLEIYGLIEDSNGHRYYLNNNNPQKNYRFLLVSPAIATVKLMSPLESNIYVDQAQSILPVASFNFEYDMNRAEALGVSALWYKAGETRNARVLVDFFDSKQDKILSLEKFVPRLASNALIKIENLPALEEAEFASFKVYSSNYTYGGDCGTSNSDFKGCDDNFGGGHRIALP